MPKKKDPFTSGKNGKYNSIYQVSFGAKTFFSMLGGFEPELMVPTQKMIVMGEDRKYRVSNTGWTGMSDSRDASIFSEIKDPEKEKEVRDYLVKIRDKYDEYLKKPEWQPYKGQLSLSRLVSDPDKGPYLDSMRDSSYLLGFRNALLGAPTINPDNFEEKTKRLSDQVDPVSGQMIKEGPLKYLDAYYASMVPLFELEYEKQNFKPGNEAAEQDLLNRMDAAFEDTINAYQNVYDFTVSHINPQTGKTEFDKYLDNDLNHIINFRRGVGWRGQFNAIGQLKGQQQAIRNGWKLGELEILGTIGQMEATLGTKAHDLELSIKYPGENADEQNAEEKQQKLQRLREFSKKLNAFKAEIYAQKVTNDSEKLIIADKVENFLDENREILDEFSTYEEYRRFTARSKETIRNRTLVKEEITDDILTAEDAENLNEYHVLEQGYNFAKVLEAKAPEVYEDIFTDKENTEDHIVHNNKFGTGFYNLPENVVPPANDRYCAYGLVSNPVHRRQNVEDEEAKALFENWVDQVHDSLGNYLHDMDEDTRFAAPMFRFINASADRKQGNFLQAKMDNPFLGNLVSQLGASPNLFIDKTEKKYLPHKEIREGLTEIGVLPHLMDFYEGGAELIETEYEKQRMMKAGWNDAAEKRYLARLSNSYSKIIDAFDKLHALPDDVQKNEAYAGSSVSHITGKLEGDFDRDCYQHIEGMRYVNQAIKNGWPARDLDVMGSFGLLVGKVERKKLFLQEAIDHPGEKATEESINEKKQQLEQLKEWEKNNLEPFKKQLLNRKYIGPETTVDTIRQIREFGKANSNSTVPFVKICVDSYITTAENRYKQINNAAIDEIQNTPSKYSARDMKAPEILNAPAAPENNIPEPPKRSEFLLHELRSVKEGRTLNQEAEQRAAASFIKSKFLESLSEEIDPRYFDNKHELYKDTQKALDNECMKYAKQCLKGIDAKNPKKLADYLEYGSHHSYFNDIYNKTNAHVAKDCFNTFTSEKNLKPNEVKIENEDFGAMMDRIEKQVKDKRPKSLDDALKDMKEATAHLGSGLYSDIKSNYGKMIEARRKFEKKLRENSLGKNESYTLKDQEKLVKFAKMEDELLKQMDKYLSKKDEVKKESSNNRLNTNGEKRYKAVHEARKTLIESAKATKAMLENTLSPELKKYLDYDSYKVDTQGLETESVVRSQKAAAEKLERELKNQAAKNPEDVLKQEADIRKGLDPNDPQYMEKLSDSAMRTIYTSALTKSKIKLTEEFTKENSPWFKNFKEKMNEDEGFRMSFNNAIYSSAVNGKTDTKDILEARDETFNAMFGSYKSFALNTPPGKARPVLESINKLNRLAKTSGSPETAEKLEVPTNEKQLGKAQKELAKQNANRQNNRVMQ